MKPNQLINKFFYKLDCKCYQSLKSISFPPQLDPFLKLYNRLGDWPFTLILLLLVPLLLPKTYWLFVYLNLLINALLSIGLYWIIKNTVCRKRPFVKYHQQAGVPPLDQYSFPSGHTMNNLAIGSAFIAYSFWLGIIAILFPITCGLLRVYYNVHYFTDVLAGIFLGLFCSVIGKFLLDWAIL